MTDNIERILPMVSEALKGQGFRPIGVVFQNSAGRTGSLTETTEDAGQPVYKLKAAPAAKIGRAAAIRTRSIQPAEAGG